MHILTADLHANIVVLLLLYTICNCDNPLLHKCFLLEICGCLLRKKYILCKKNATNMSPYNEKTDCCVILSFFVMYYTSTEDTSVKF